MPKVALTQENKQAQNTDYPKLSLDYGERALILAIEPEPTTQYRHDLEAPEIGPDGKVLKEEKKKADGTPYEKPKMEWFGRHLCFGDFDTVSENGSDPANCPTCAAAAENDAIATPKQYYAMHVIRYALQPGGFQLRDPFNVECVAWVFSGNRLNTIIDIATEWGDLRKHDLKLGPCESKQYQKYEIQVASSAQWLANDERKQFVAQTYANNQCEDLEALIGRRVTKVQALEDIQKVLDRMEQITNPGKSVQVPDLSGLQQQGHSQAAQDSSDPLDVFSPPTEQEKAAAENFSADANTADTEDKPADKPLKQMDFADILKDL